MNYKNYKRTLRHILGVPFIWIVLFPVLLFDLFIEIYHRICFPLYGLEYVKRSEYVRFDRYKLPYLKWYDRINCLYCEYVNGFLHYATEIAAQTEKYWCGIKHENVKGFKAPAHHSEFKLEYGDAKSFKKHCKMQKKD